MLYVAEMKERERGCNFFSYYIHIIKTIFLNSIIINN